MNRYFFDLLRLWLREYFNHPLENIRTARPVVPGKLYNNFGNACKAVRYTDDEAAYIRQGSISYGTDQRCPDVFLELVKAFNGNREKVKAFQREMERQDLPRRCMLCDFHNNGIPCPIYNELADETTVCDTYKYVIIKKAKRYV